MSQSKNAALGQSHPFPRLARLTLERHLAGIPATGSLPAEVAEDPELWAARRGVFVSIKTRDGALLRGCIGTIGPVQADLGREIMANAVAAGTRDPRFPPLEPGELAGLVFSVDVLGPPEPVSSLDQLDPAVWGVIVSKDGRRGLLLPDLPGVERADDQLTIAARKAGIRDLTGAEIFRFRVDRYSEPREGLDLV